MQKYVRAFGSLTARMLIEADFISGAQVNMYYIYIYMCMSFDAGIEIKGNTYVTLCICFEYK